MSEMKIPLRDTIFYYEEATATEQILEMPIFQEEQLTVEWALVRRTLRNQLISMRQQSDILRNQERILGLLQRIVSDL